MTREEFASYLLERADSVLDVGKVIRFVESVLKLQSDVSRPVYIFEVERDISQEDIELIDRTMASLKVACALVPKGVMTYAGEVDSESFGQKNMVDEVRAALIGGGNGR